jgi:hypothetical protein
VTPLQWLQAFAAFVPVASEIVDAFVDEHPELRDPPAEPERQDIWDAFTSKLDKRFPRDGDE